MKEISIFPKGNLHIKILRVGEFSNPSARFSSKSLGSKFPLEDSIKILKKKREKRKKRKFLNSREAKFPKFPKLASRCAKKKTSRSSEGNPLASRRRQISKFPKQCISLNEKKKGKLARGLNPPWRKESARAPDGENFN